MPAILRPSRIIRGTTDRAEGTPSIRPITPYESYKNKFRDFADRIQIPGLAPEGVGTAIEGLFPAESDNDISSMASPMEAPAAVAAGIIPKQYLRKLAQEVAAEADDVYRLAGLPKIRNVATMMAGNHPLIAGHLSGHGVGTSAKNFSGEFIRGDTELARKIIAKTPTSTYTPGFYKRILDNYGEEKLGEVARRQMGRININPEMENEPIANIFKTMRHEYAHATEDLMGDVAYKTRTGPQYWPSHEEVRARAIGRNYGRDMGIPDANRIAPGLRPIETTKSTSLKDALRELDARGASDSEYRQLLSTSSKNLNKGETWRKKVEDWIKYEETKTGAKYRRTPYSLSLVNELDTGIDIGKQKAQTTAERTGVGEEATSTFRHYFGGTPKLLPNNPHGVTSFNMTGPPRLNPSESWAMPNWADDYYRDNRLGRPWW